MSTIQLQTKIESDTLCLPELKRLVGKTVTITIQETPQATVKEQDWETFFASAGKDLVDADLYQQYREFDRKQNQPPQL